MTGLMTCFMGNLMGNFMDRAITLALEGKGRTAPNPCVGAVLVRDGLIVAEGFHQKYGDPHAEVEAIADARKKGVAPAGCDLYVTLEPCNHTGKTPPCTQAILEAGIRRVVIGTPDPNPEVAGGGAEFLRQNGVAVEIGICEAKCLDLIADFRLWKTTKRTYNYLKLAATLDGHIADRSGGSHWISGPESRACVHDLRGRVDAVVVGPNTLLRDNPRLTCRANSFSADSFSGEQPLAVLVCPTLPDPGAKLYLLRERPTETVFWTGEAEALSDRAKALQEKGCRVWPLPDLEGRLELSEGYRRLRQELGCHSTLCEGGGNLAMGLLCAGLVDEFHLYMAPKVLGDETAPALFSGQGPCTLDKSLPLRITDTQPCGEDIRLTLRPKTG
jgi:diaminohydroxyphosphoribosylaminopyrimidine deaminase / 5-amino-6-(5-phosphoribosylamino)uracil reductase